MDIQPLNPMSPEVRCETCNRTLVELGSMFYTKGEHICGECFGKRLGDFMEIDHLNIIEIMPLAKAKERYGGWVGSQGTG